jgi:hypothetical protein
MLSHLNIVLIVLLILGVVYLFYPTIMAKLGREHFTAEPSDSYVSRMNVMSVFDTLLSRKPTGEEIEKYSKLKNEQDILSAIMKDNAGVPIHVAPLVTAENSVKDQVHSEEVKISSEPFLIDEKSLSDRDSLISSVSKISADLTAVLQRLEALPVF